MVFLKSTLSVIAIVLVLAYIVSRTNENTRAAHSSVSSKISSVSAGSCKPQHRTFKIRVVHHGSYDDSFWLDVAQGMRDATSMFRNIELQIFEGISQMNENIYGAITSSDALIVTCPYFQGSREYEALDKAIHAVLDSNIPVITMNTDTYENPRVIQYVGSLNKLLGVRAARMTKDKWNELPDVDNIVCFVTEKFNVTLDWRADNFSKEFNLLYGKNVPMHKCYSLQEIQSKFYDNKRCFLLSLGVVTLKQLEAVFNKFSDIKGCQCGDTGAEVSQLCNKFGIPFVGQQQYQQGFSAISAMSNILLNYEKGETWNREQGNSASVLNATFECKDSEECSLSSEPQEPRPDKKKNGTEWIQVGVAIFLQGANIAAWDEYDKAKRRKDATNSVHLENGETEQVSILDGTQNFDATDDWEDAERRYYPGILNEHFRFLPIYERSIDREQSKYQYYVVTENATRVLATSNKGVEKISDGMFVKIPNSNSTFRALLYDREELFGLQRALKGSLGNKCAEC